MSNQTKIMFDLSDEQWKSFLNEDRHYPVFLDGFFDTVGNEIGKLFDEMKKDNVSYKTYDIKVDSPLTDKIECEIYIRPKFAEDPEDERHVENNIKNYNAFYNGAEGYENGKLISPSMSVVICCDAVTYNTNKKLVNAAVSHELVHLYDDWLHYDLYNTSLDSEKRIEKSGKAITQRQRYSDDNLFGNILFMIYLSSSAEKKAYTAEVVKDLKYLGCTRYNFNEKVRQTSAWRNYNKTNNYIQNALKTCSDSELENINNILKTRYTKCGVPFVEGFFMSFSEYRKKLSIWSEKITKMMNRKIVNITGYYLDNKFSGGFVVK